MKRFLSITFILFFSIIINAQTYWDGARADKFITYGLRAGINFSKQYDTNYLKDLEFKTGFQLGIELDLNLCRSFSVNTIIEFIQKGYKCDFTDYNQLFISDNAKYIELPLLASYRIALSDATQCQINVGPYFSYGIAGQRKVETSNDVEEINSFDEYDGLKKFDMGISYGIGLTLSRLYIGVNYERSVVKLGQDSDNGAKNGSIVISIGYNFN